MLGNGEDARFPFPMFTMSNLLYSIVSPREPVVPRGNEPLVPVRLQD